VNKDTARLFLVAACCFLPGALLALCWYKKSQQTAALILRLSIFLFMIIVCLTGFYIVIKGGKVIPALSSFY
jgi:cytochrome b561